MRKLLGPFCVGFYSGLQVRLLVGLIALKILITAVNAYNYDVRDQYDAKVHFIRISTCGIYTTVRNYNPPAYYLLSCPTVILTLLGKVDVSDFKRVITSADFSLKDLIDKYQKDLKSEYITKDLSAPFLKIINLIMLIGLYLVSIFNFFPRFIRNKDSATIVSVALLALPGFQKLAVMTHPDNLMIFSVVCLFSVWSRWPDRDIPNARTMTELGLWGGIGSFARPSAIVPVGILAVLATIRSLVALRTASSGVHKRHILQAYCLFVILGCVIGGSWWVYRYATVGTVISIVEEDASAKLFRERRKDFDYLNFYTSTHFLKLLRTPNRKFDGAPADWRESENNSFMTVLLSDFWADHWLYFSGPKSEDKKKLFKSLLLGYALLLTPFFLYFFARGSQRVWARIREGDNRYNYLFVLTIVIGGLAFFVAFASIFALEPGIHAAIKFIYLAYIIPFILIILGCGLYIGDFSKKFAFSSVIILYLLALPVSLYWR